MSYKLFKAEQKIVAYFWAREDDELQELASECLAAEPSHSPVSDVYEVTEDTVIEDHWVGGIPYGDIGDDDRTVGEIVSSEDFGYYSDEEMESDIYDMSVLEDEPDDNTDPADIWKDEL